MYTSPSLFMLGIVQCILARYSPRTPSRAASSRATLTGPQGEGNEISPLLIISILCSALMQIPYCVLLNMQSGRRVVVRALDHGGTGKVAPPQCAYYNAFIGLWSTPIPYSATIAKRFRVEGTLPDEMCPRRGFVLQ